MKKVLITIGVIAVAVAVGVFVYLNYVGKKTETVKIGTVLPLTGSMANYGISLKRGFDLAVSEINAAGGINGKQLVIIHEDSKSDAKTGVTAFKKLVTTNKVPLVFGSLSNVILAIQPVADEQGVVLINSSAISPNIREMANNFLFSIMVNGATEAIFMANKFQEKYPNEKLAILYSNNSSGVDTKDALVSELQSLGNTNVHIESYELNTTDFKVQIDKIKRSGAKYGYLLAWSATEIASILKQIKEFGLDIQWFSHSGIETRETLELAREAADGIIYSYPKYNVSDTLFSHFQTEFQTKYKIWGDICAITAYDGIYLIADVMKKYGTTSLEIQNGLRSIDGFNGIFGGIDFSKSGKQYTEKELFWKKIENNQYIILE